MSLISVKDYFPGAKQKVKGKELVYLDSAASTLKCKPSIERLSNFYLYESANVHRGAHTLSDLATESYEAAREIVRDFVNANSVNEVIFTSGTTDSINLVASSLTSTLNSDSEVLITELEHHSNIVPWQVACEKSGAKLKYIPIHNEGGLDLSELDQLINSKTSVVSLNAISNALGVINPVEEIIRRARKVGAKVLIDAAQSVAVMKTDVLALDCDFLVFSGHKLFAPNGIGVLYGKEALLNEMPPFKTGGSMIEHVTKQKSTYLNAPQRFEAGTPHVGGAIGLAEAIKFVNTIGFEEIKAHEKQLLEFVTEELNKIEGVTIYGNGQPRSNICSFNIEGAHPSDIGHLMDQQGIAIRSGHHCCQPLMEALGVTGTVRASFSIYNDMQDAQKFVDAVKKCKEFI